jgi:hypothetical protein
MTDATRTDYRKLFDKDYIGAWDLTDKDVTVSITKVAGGELVGPGGRKSKKPIVFMNGTKKGFAINSTNGKTIAAMYGNFVQDWVGKRITLYKSTTRNPNGEGEVECIRVRPQIPATPQRGSGEEAPAAEAPQI